MNSKQRVQTICEKLWVQKDLSVLDDSFAQNAKIHSPFNVKFGVLTMRQIVQKWLTAFPDLLIRWNDFIADDNKVAVQWQAEATHLGSFFDTKPTHHEVYYSGVTIYTLDDDKVSSYWALVDVHSILKQIGADSLEEVID